MIWLFSPCFWCNTQMHFGRPPRTILKHTKSSFSVLQLDSRMPCWTTHGVKWDGHEKWGHLLKTGWLRVSKHQKCHKTHKISPTARWNLVKIACFYIELSRNSTLRGPRSHPSNRGKNREPKFIPFSQSVRGARVCTSNALSQPMKTGWVNNTVGSPCKRG